jgi:hypothetical protein
MIIRYNYMLLYVMIIMNRSIVSLILIKYYVMLVVGLNLLLMIEYVMCYLCKLCFDARKLVIWIVLNFVFLTRELMTENIFLG